jgi:amidase
VSDELAFAGVGRQAELVRSGQVSPRELVELYLERIEGLDPQLNAYRVVMAERALEEADRAEQRRAHGEDLPLLGVPLAIKDEMDVAGEVTAHGSDAYGDPASEDSEIVRRLRAAGAIPIGKTNVPELEICGFTESERWGVTRNPWDPGRTPGGSSGGTGAAVAAGLAAAGTASDGAGSIRIPAANCGLFGLKPQRGRISLAPAKSMWNGYSVFGFNTRTVIDTALLLDVAAGPAPGDIAAPPPPRAPYLEAARSSPPKLRVAVSTRSLVPLAPIDAGTRQGLEDTAELLRALGHEVSRRNPSYSLSIGNDFFPRWWDGIRQHAESMAHPERLEPRTRGFARLGRLFHRRVAKAMANEAKHAARANRLFEEFDVLLTPTNAKLPVEVERWKGKGAVRTNIGMSFVYPFCALWNYLGQPAASVPAGLSAEGVPLSAQLLGPPNSEELLVSLAAQIEAERPWADRRPPVS